MVYSQCIRSPEPREQALGFVLGRGHNQVCLDECDFIWDSRDLIEDGDQTLPEQVAIFGIKGKVSTPQLRLQSFIVRHNYDFAANSVGLEGYSIQAAVTDEPDGETRSLKVLFEDRKEDRGLHIFKESVKLLTNEFSKRGRVDTLKRFLSYSSPVDGLDEPSRANRVDGSYGVNETTRTNGTGSSNLGTERVNGANGGNETTRNHSPSLH